MDKKFLIAIPARKGSKRIKNKNIYPFRGKPLMVHTIEAAKALDLPNKRIIVTTDSPEFGKIAVDNGAEYINRPEQYAGDLSPDIEWLRHALDFLKSSDGYDPDYIIHLRPSTPLRDPARIKNIIEHFLKDGVADALRTVEPLNIVVEKSVYPGEDGYMRDYFDKNLREINLCAQNFKAPYTANGYVDIFKNMDFHEQFDVFHNLKVIPYITEEILDIDTLKDLEDHGKN